MTDEPLLENLKSCQKIISESIIKILDEIPSQEKITIQDDIYKKYHNLLELRYSIDVFLEKFK